MGPASRGDGGEAPLRLVAPLDFESRSEPGHAVQSGPGGVDVAQQVRFRVAREIDEGTAPLGQSAITVVEPFRRPRQRFARRVLEAGELGMRVPVPHVDQGGAAAVSLVAKQAREIGLLEMSVDGKVLARLQGDPDLQDDRGISAELVLDDRHLRYYNPTCLWKLRRN